MKFLKMRDNVKKLELDRVAAERAHDEVLKRLKSTLTIDDVKDYIELRKLEGLTEDKITGAAKYTYNFKGLDELKPEYYFDYCLDISKIITEKELKPLIGNIFYRRNQLDIFSDRFAYKDPYKLVAVENDTFCMFVSKGKANGDQIYQDGPVSDFNVLFTSKKPKS